MSQKSRILYFDVMNVLACICVVAAHHNNQLHTYQASLGWNFSLAMECIVCWAVPVFLMVSGATLMGFHQRYSLKQYFLRRFTRAVIPWLFWSTAILLWKLSIGQIQSGEGPVYYLRLILTNQVEGIFWFFGTLFGCYLMIPLLTWLIPHRKALWYGVAGIFLLSLIHPLVPQYTPLSNDAVTSLRNSLVIFILLGYLLNTAEFTKKQRLCMYLVGILAALFRFTVTWVVSAEQQATSLLVRGNKTCTTIVLSSAVFVFLKHVDWEKLLPQAVQRIISTLAGYSFGVYLLHKVVMYYEQQLLGVTLSDIAYKTLWVPVTYGVCVLIIFLLKKIPFLGKYLC